MRIHLDQIKGTGLSLAYNEPAGSFPVLFEMKQSGECDFLSPIDIRLEVTRIGDIVNVEGEVHASIHLVCDRCLREFDTDLASVFSLTYSQDFNESNHQGGEELELSAEELGLMPIQGEEIDFRDGIQEQIVMALPLRALCSDDCKGLCPQCGADRNRVDCSCTKVVPAGRFAALRKLKLEGQSD
jgi:uncharacterized protein